jgi:hypothetical protein
MDVFELENGKQFFRILEIEFPIHSSSPYSLPFIFRDTETMPLFMCFSALVPILTRSYDRTAARQLPKSEQADGHIGPLLCVLWVRWMASSRLGDLFVGRRMENSGK